MIVRAMILGALCATPFAVAFGDTVGVVLTLVFAAGFGILAVAGES